MMKNVVLRTLALLLAAALQVMPMLRSLLPAMAQEFTPSAWSAILKIGTGTAALLGSYDAVSGATASIVVEGGNYVSSGGHYTIYLTNNVFYFNLLGTVGYQPNSWSINNASNPSTKAFQLLSGFSLTNLSGAIGGVPSSTILKTNTFEITAWEGSQNNESYVYTNFTFITFPSTPGALSVTSTPPAVASLASNLTWNIDGGGWMTNGVTNIYVLPGTHTVNFTNVYGWLAPTSQQVTITSSTLTKISGVYTQLFGGLQVNLQPAGLAAALGKWQVDGSGSYPSGIITNLGMSGTHSLTFTAVSGFTTPPTQTITVTNGATNLITAVYLSSSSGNLLVNLGPSGATAAGARWELDNSGIWLASGVSTNAAAGSHTVTFTNLAGWTTPNAQTVTLTNGTLYTVNATYVIAPSGALQANLGPAGAVNAGAQWQVNGGAYQNSGAVVSGLNAGSYTVAFKPVSGWISPVTQTPTVTGNATNVIMGTYVQIAAPLITSLTLNGTTLTLTGTGTSGAGFSVLSTNNLTAPLGSWPVIYSGTITNGSFIYTNQVSSSVTNLFYSISSQ